MDTDHDKKYKVFNRDDLTINEDSPEEPYRRRNNEDKTTVSWGQRKLLLTLVQFLSLYWNPKDVPNPVVVYAGGAPGINIRNVAKLFPEVTFHLYDPRPFKLKPNRKMHIYQEKFTNKIATNWSKIHKRNKNVFFISDIRTADYITINDLDKNEQQILKDMYMQQKWHLIIKPIKSHLKFRLPYTGGNRPESVNYLCGDVYKQPWTGQTSTETRLVPYDNKKKHWSCRKYQSRLFHHNTIVREHNKYINPFTKDESPIDSPELTNDWDSQCESQIWIDYLLSRKLQVTHQAVNDLSRKATKNLTYKRVYKDTLSSLRKNPRAIKERNMK